MDIPYFSHSLFITSQIILNSESVIFKGKLRSMLMYPPLMPAVTTDPVSININFGLERAAWFAFHILLSDLYTAGMRGGIHEHRP